MRFCGLPYFAVLGALVLSGFAASAAKADLVLGNLPSNDGGFSTISQSSGTSDKGAGFTIGSTTLLVTDAQLRLSVAAGAVPQLRLFDSNGSGLPQNALFTFANPTFTTGVNATYTFTPSSSFYLTPGVRYWLVLSNAGTAASAITWRRSEPNVTPTGPYATHNGYRTTGTTFLDTTSGLLNSYAVNGSVVVPEAGTLPLLGLILPMAAGIALRRKLR